MSHSTIPHLTPVLYVCAYTYMYAYMHVTEHYNMYATELHNG